MRRHLLRVFVLLAVLTAGLTAVSAQDDGAPPPQLDTALADLAARLGQTVSVESLSNWTFEQNVYTDTALGCAARQGEPAPQGISAYRFSITYQGVTYDYRVSADNGIVFPCDEALLQVTPPTQVESPELACPANFEGYLTPRLGVNTQAQVTPGNVPNRLRSAPSVDAEQIGVIEPGRVFDIIGGPACDPAGYVWWQVVVDGVTGWTAEGQLPDQYFLEPLEPASEAEVTEAPVDVSDPLPTAEAEATAAPDVVTDGEGVRVAALTDEATLALFDLSAAGEFSQVAEVTDFEESFALRGMAWSPNGQYLAYAALDEENQVDIWVTDREGSAPMLIADNVNSTLPPTFSSDSQQVIYTQYDQQAESGNASIINVLGRDVAGAEDAALLATFEYGVGCGGGGGTPADRQYWTDTGAGPGIEQQTFTMTDYGIVYTTNCTGRQTALLNLETGESTEIGVNLGKVSVSPDGERVAGVGDLTTGASSGTLTLVDLATLELTPLGAAAVPDQVGWGPNGDIYYSVRGETPEDGIALHRVNLAETTDSQVYSADAFAIGRIFPVAGQNFVYFSQVPQNVTDDSDVPAPDDFDEESLLSVPVSLIRIPAGGGEAALIGTGLRQVTPNPTPNVALSGDAATPEATEPAVG